MSSSEDELSRCKFFKLAVLGRHAKNYKRGTCAVLDFEFIPNFKFHKKRPMTFISKFVYLNSKRFPTMLRVAAVLLEDGREVVLQSKTKWKRGAALTCLQRYAKRHDTVLQVRRR